MTCASGEDSDQSGQSGHPPSLIRVFVVCMKKHWVLSYPLSAQWRYWSESSLGTQFILLVLSCGGSNGTDIWLAFFFVLGVPYTNFERLQKLDQMGRVKRIWYLSPMRAMSQEEPSNRKPDPWLLWMSGHAQLKYVMTELTQIRLTGLKWCL